MGQAQATYAHPTKLGPVILDQLIAADRLSPTTRVYTIRLLRCKNFPVTDLILGEADPYIQVFLQAQYRTIRDIVDAFYYVSD